MSAVMERVERVGNEDAAAVWEEYLATRSEEACWRLVELYLPLTVKIAKSLIVRSKIVGEVDDLAQEGVFGLIDAVRKFDPSRGEDFTRYAGFRIRGSILDSSRRRDWVSKEVRASAKRGERHLPAMASVTSFSHPDRNRRPSKHAFEWEHVPGRDDGFRHVEDRLDAHDVLRRSGLTERERRIVELHYIDGLEQREVAKLVGLAPSRISQILPQIFEQMRYARRRQPSQAEAVR